MKYHNEQNKCSKSKMNGKGFCDYGIFKNTSCICSKTKLYCPFAWKKKSNKINNLHNQKNSLDITQDFEIFENLVL